MEGTLCCGPYYTTENFFNTLLSLHIDLYHQSQSVVVGRISPEFLFYIPVGIFKKYMYLLVAWLFPMPYIHLVHVLAVKRQFSTY